MISNGKQDKNRAYVGVTFLEHDAFMAKVVAVYICTAKTNVKSREPLLKKKKAYYEGFFLPSLFCMNTQFITGM